MGASLLALAKSIYYFIFIQFVKPPLIPGRKNVCVLVQNLQAHH